VIESDAEVVVDRSMFWGAGIYGSHAESSLAAPGTTWYLAEEATHGSFDLFYLLQNPNPSDALVQVRYLRTSGVPPLERTYVVPARRRLNILVYTLPGNSRRTIWVAGRTHGWRRRRSRPSSR
jgi:hypothetical protein